MQKWEWMSRTTGKTLAELFATRKQMLFEFGNHHNQIDYILLKRRFHTGVNIARTRSFPGANIGRDHDLLMKIFHIRLSKPKPTRIKFDIEKLKDPDVAEAFKAMIGGKFEKEKM